MAGVRGIPLPAPGPREGHLPLGEAAAGSAGRARRVDPGRGVRDLALSVAGPPSPSTRGSPARPPSWSAQACGPSSAARNAWWTCSAAWPCPRRPRAPLSTSADLMLRMCPRSSVGPANRSDRPRDRDPRRPPPTMAAIRRPVRRRGRSARRARVRPAPGAAAPYAERLAANDRPAWRPDPSSPAYDYYDLLVAEIRPIRATPHRPDRTDDSHLPGAGGRRRGARYPSAEPACDMFQNIPDPLDVPCAWRYHYATF